MFVYEQPPLELESPCGPSSPAGSEREAAFFRSEEGVGKPREAKD